AMNRQKEVSQQIDEPNCKSLFRWIHLSVGGKKHSELFPKFFLLIILLLLPASVLSQQPTASPVAVESSLDKNNITIGDTVRYSVKLTRDKNVQVRWPALGANLGAFEIRDYYKPDPRQAKGRVVEEIAYTISTFDTGRFVIPPLAIEYQTPPDSIWHQLQTEKLEIYVASTLPSEAGDIRDIKSPWELPRDWKLIIRIGLIVLAILLLAAAGFYYWRKKQGKGILPERKELPRPAHEVALEALRKLRESDLLATGQIKAFYIELSEIVRRYIEGRYFVPALELTTGELMDDLKQVTLESEARNLLRGLLEMSDLVKFAKYAPANEEHERALQLVESFVETTKLVMAAPIEGQATNGKTPDAPSSNAKPVENTAEVA
ncbi:MAG: hypothetical protein ACRENG_05000, partial [bacterium]